MVIRVGLILSWESCLSCLKPWSNSYSLDSDCAWTSNFSWYQYDYRTFCHVQTFNTLFPFYYSCRLL